MTKKLKLFDEVTTYDDVKNIIRENVNYLNNGYFNIESLTEGINSLNNLPLDKQSKVLKLVNQIDKTMSLPGSANQNSYHKIPTLLAGILYYDKYDNQISSYSLDEQTILAHYSITQGPTFYQSATKTYNKQIISCIAIKSKDLFTRDDLMFLTQQLIVEEKKGEEIIEYITSTPQDTLIDEVNKRKIELIKPMLGEFKL